MNLALRMILLHLNDDPGTQERLVVVRKVVFEGILIFFMKCLGAFLILAIKRKFQYPNYDPIAKGRLEAMRKVVFEGILLF